MTKAQKAAADAEKLKEQRLEDYNKVVAVAELGSIQLVKLEFDVSPDYHQKQDEVDLGYVITPEVSHYDHDEGFAGCVINFEVSAKHDDERLLRCEATYTVTYAISEPCDETAVKAFLGRVGVFACYPYFRGVFANLDWAANTRLPPLPIHREDLPRKTKKKSRKKLAKAMDEDTN
ncbi:hypothetical protein QTL95_14395 [Rhizobium sp. S152]|uniref:hypothetical protein n=1 Tax=Rhizobium sp. S152 TaxID=3055038 RepID=UPI0025A94AA8|nr:hypothetical protein [Rhizobium sp. S152]MDM9627094.1 hypothetical protein [Rhizobium sp. S152]